MTLPLLIAREADPLTAAQLKEWVNSDVGSEEDPLVLDLQTAAREWLETASGLDLALTPGNCACAPSVPSSSCPVPRWPM